MRHSDADTRLEVDRLVERDPVDPRAELCLAPERLERVVDAEEHFLCHARVRRSSPGGSRRVDRQFRQRDALVHGRQALGMKEDIQTLLLLTMGFASHFRQGLSAKGCRVSGHPRDSVALGFVRLCHHVVAGAVAPLERIANLRDSASGRARRTG
jgi:hypothetical protein